MTPLFCQKAIIQKLNDIFKEYPLPDPKNKGKYKSLTVYHNDLPIPDYAADGEYSDENSEYFEQYFPYIIVRINGGNVEEGTDSRYLVNITLAVGVYDDSSDKQGYEYVVNVITRIYQEFFKVRLLEEKYQIEYPFEWELQDPFDGDTWPYCFGAVSTRWTVGKITREGLYI